MNDDDWDQRDIAKECSELKFKLDLANGTIQFLETKVDEIQRESDELKDTLDAVKGKVDELERTVKKHQTDLEDETYLFTTSQPFKRMSFRLWLHDTYHRLVDSDSRNPQLDISCVNEELRNFYTPRKTPVDPPTFVKRSIKTEDSYLSKLNYLHCQINAWVKKSIADREEFTLEQLGVFLDRLKGLSRTGERTCSRFRPEMISLNFDCRGFHQKLYKHLLSLIIHERVLSCFAFRMDAITSKQLYAIENAILTAGHFSFEIADNRRPLRHDPRTTPASRNSFSPIRRQHPTCRTKTFPCRRNNGTLQQPRPLRG